MAINKATRLSKIAREFNVGIATIVDFLHSKGVKLDTNPNTKVTPEHYAMVEHEFSNDLTVKKESEKVNLRQLREKRESVSINDVNDEEQPSKEAGESDELLVQDTNIKSNIFETETEKNLDQNINLNVVGKIELEKKQVEEKAVPEEVVPEEVKELKAPVEETPALEEVKASEEVPVVEEAKKEKIVEPEPEEPKEEEKINHPKVLGTIDLDSMNQKTKPARKKKTKGEPASENKEKPNTKKDKPESETTEKVVEKTAPVETKQEPVQEIIPKVEPIPETTQEEVPPKVVDDVIRAKVKKLNGPTVVGKIDLPKTEPKKDGDRGAGDRRKKRKRIKKDKERVKVNQEPGQKSGQKPEDRSSANKKVVRKRKTRKPEVSEVDVQKQVKDTLARLTSKGKSRGAKHRREKRDAVSQKAQDLEKLHEAEKNIIKVTEFVSVNELASMMDVTATEVISTCMSLGLFVSINQRLDAETMSLVADEFGYKVEFISVEVQEAIREEEDKPEDLKARPPIVTVMGHVDHGKTKLLDFVRSANVIGGEAGGITQHIGAYGVKLEDGRQITFLDTPGHEAFTAMRARGAQVTDVAIIVVAADDGVKPQTVEAINHAQAANVPMVFAINKIDKASANPERVKEELANMNLLVEDWGGKFQSQEISAKDGLNISELLEKVLLEAELLELTANPNKKASGTVVESSLDKGRGYVTTILVQAGTLKIGDIVLAGTHHGRVKNMYNERGVEVKEAGPSVPVLVLGLNGAPQAGDTFNIIENDKEAREIANKREQLQREQGLRTQKHITLDEIGRRIAIGNFQELNIIVKGDVDGSIEALSDSLIKLSSEEIQVNIIHKGVGQISESDIMLATASDAIVVGFQVRPSLAARRLAEKEEIDVRLYSIIYDAIDEVKSAMEGMLSPEIKENITATLEILEVFNITKVGTIAGCMVKEGKIKRTSKVRVIRDGIVIFSGELGALKRFKDEVKEVVSGLECGLNIKNYNDIKEGDHVEAYEQFEVKKKL